MSASEPYPDPGSPSPSDSYSDPVVQAIRRYLEGLFREAGEPMRLEIEVRLKGRTASVELKGAELLHGQEGRILQALTHLVELYLRRELRRQVRVQLDVDGYRAQRIAELGRLAREVAAEVAQARRQKRVRLNPMEAWERKAIHEALSAYPGVRTYSEGQGSERRVIIEREPSPQQRRV